MVAPNQWLEGEEYIKFEGYVKVNIMWVQISLVDYDNYHIINNKHIMGFKKLIMLCITFNISNKQANPYKTSMSHIKSNLMK